MAEISASASASCHHQHHHHLLRATSQTKALSPQATRAFTRSARIASHYGSSQLGGRKSQIPSSQRMYTTPAGGTTPNNLGDRCGVESTTTGEPTIHAVFEENTSTWQYIVSDPSSSSAVIIDPVLDYDRATQTITTDSADALLQKVRDCGYKIEMILETHVHADHLTAASYLQNRLAHLQHGLKPPIGIGKRIVQVQNLFGARYGVPVEEYKGVFGKLFEDDEVFHIGGLRASTVHLPGHTPDHLGYRIGENIFCGDSIFHADIGTARCDFPGGSAHALFQSCRKLLSLPDDVKIWTGHDYPPDDRPRPCPWMTVEEHRRLNRHLRDGTGEDEYIALREERDAQLPAPKLLHQSLQFNIRAGRLPAPTKAGFRLLHLPLRLDEVEEW
ncbi:MBL fold metallo-hydrolase [Aspergillus candidus]|uniref:Metallo-hydrolase/oxidoreductase n=1 Tax=Aspergillus candidus TaxID=41067 RepID=A0A2I2EYL4_ASPCN|nr:Metallo-hydrolase/oxidoreductase [Aspergillus candidus]PLB33476.1 Metallo-hydrolase/oxidoreductase [Aspergillus candidus]